MNHKCMENCFLFLCSGDLVNTNPFSPSKVEDVEALESIIVVMDHTNMLLRQKERRCSLKDIRNSHAKFFK